MKTVVRNTTFLLLALLLGSPFISSGQVIMDENFDYTAGDNITSHGWTAHSGGGTQPITVNNGGLTFTGYVNSGGGNAALVDNNGEDDNKTFTTQTSGIVYAAFMVRINTTSAGYFLHLGPNPISTTFKGRVFMDASNHFGLSFENGTVTYASTTYTIGHTYLLVLKYQIVAGSTNDKVSLYVFDTSFPETEPVTPTIGPVTDATKADINPGAIGLRQYSATQNVVVDGIRISSSWSDLVAPPVIVPTLSEWGLILLGFVLVAAGTVFILRRG